MLVHETNELPLVGERPFAVDAQNVEDNAPRLTHAQGVLEQVDEHLRRQGFGACPPRRVRNDGNGGEERRGTCLTHQACHTEEGLVTTLRRFPAEAPPPPTQLGQKSSSAVTCNVCGTK